MGIGAGVLVYSVSAPFGAGGRRGNRVSDLIMRQHECPRCRQPFFRNESKVFGVSAEDGHTGLGDVQVADYRPESAEGGVAQAVGVVMEEDPLVRA